MGLWQGVAMDSLKYCQGLPCPTLNALKAVLGLARPQGLRPEPIFYPLGHPMHYAYDFETWDVAFIINLAFVKSKSSNLKPLC